MQRSYNKNSSRKDPNYKQKVAIECPHLLVRWQPADQVKTRVTLSEWATLASLYPTGLDSQGCWDIVARQLAFTALETGMSEGKLYSAKV